jgi:hypothetical protein
MLKLDASGLFAALNQLSSFQALVKANSDRLSPDVPLSDEITPTYKSVAERVLVELETLQTMAAYIRLERLIRYMMRLKT